jgi:hypothetical protein
MLDRVFEKIDEHALDEDAIELEHRQVRGKLDLNRQAGVARFHRAHAAADHFLERLPRLEELDPPRAQPGHVEQVLDHPGQAHRLLAQLGGHPAKLGRQRRFAAGQRIGQPDDDGQRRAQVVRHRGQHRRAQAFDSISTCAARDFDEGTRSTAVEPCHGITTGAG